MGDGALVSHVCHDQNLHISSILLIEDMSIRTSVFKSNCRGSNVPLKA